MKQFRYVFHASKGGMGTRLSVCPIMHMFTYVLSYYIYAVYM